MNDKPHIFLKNGKWRLRIGDKETEAAGSFEDACWAARFFRRSQMIRRAGIETNQMVDARPYVNPRAG